MNLMNPRTWIAAILTLAALTAGLGAAGVFGQGPDPRDRVREYVLTATRCGEQGAGRSYDITTGEHRSWTRQEALDYERGHGCHDRPQPRLQVHLIDEHDDVAVVRVWREPIPPDDGAQGMFVLVRQDGQWLIDIGQSTDAQDLIP